jgi:hypothetical protein
MSGIKKIYAYSNYSTSKQRKRPNTARGKKSINGPKNHPLIKKIMKKQKNTPDHNTNHHSKTRLKGEYTSIDSVACFGEDPPLSIIPSNTSLKPLPTVWFTLLVTSLFGIQAVILHFETNQAPATVVMTSPDEEATKEEVVKVINKNFSNNIQFIAAQC